MQALDDAPDLVAPGSEAEMADAIRAASGPLAVRGGGTRSPAAAGAVLSTAGLSGITLYEPGALTLMAKAGTPLAEVQAALSGEGQRLAFEPPDMRRVLGTSGDSTIGGVVAANASGPRRVVAGACRDALLGVRFVDGTGMVVKNGGRVMKNVTGYDLARLMAGSRGRLCVLTEVALKVLPGVAAEASVVLRGLSVADAVGAMAAALGSPFEVTGAAHLPDAEGGARTVLRIEGSEASVAYRAERLKDRLAAHGDASVEEGAAGWDDIRDAVPMAGGQGDVWRLSVRPSHAPEVIARLDAAAFFLDWGGGLIWARTEAGGDPRAALGGFGGHATKLRGNGGGAMPPVAPEVAALTRGLRAKFDPRGIFAAPGG